MRRTIHDHKVNGLSEAITITVLGSPGPGGANHCYELELNPLRASFHGQSGEDMVPPPKFLYIEFQNGPIGEAGFNGFSNEALLAVLIDRMRGFQHKRIGQSQSHKYWGAGEANCPADIKAANGELHTLKCKVCGEESPRTPVCSAPAGNTEFDFNTRGQFACRENACALTHLEEAMMWLQKRTRDRMARGVEGTHST